MSSKSRVLFSSKVESFFEVKKRRTTIGTEFRGAIATFLTMAYILVTNATILAAAGVPTESAIACTALAAAICSIAMGLFANFPLALASGMGLNAAVAFQLTPQIGNWQTAMGLVVLDGLVIALLVLVGFREAVMKAIPRPIKLAISSGIGLFIAFIGLVTAKLVVVPAGTVAVLSANPGAVLPPITFGSLSTPEAKVGLLGILITAVLVSQRFRGAIIAGIAASTFLAVLFGLAKFNGTFSLPNFDIAFQADVLGALKWQFVPMLLALVLVDFFDTLGTVTGVAEEAGLESKQGKIPRLKQILMVDSLSASVGGLLGVSSVTSYVESASGVAEGARTGLHSVFVGLFFLVCVFAAPLVSFIPNCATAPALVLVGFIMSSHITEIKFRDYDTGIPAFITFLTIPLTYSISHGIGYGFISYVAIQILSGKMKSLNPIMLGSSVVFLLYFVLS